MDFETNDSIVDGHETARRNAGLSRLKTPATATTAVAAAATGSDTTRRKAGLLSKKQATEAPAPEPAPEPEMRSGGTTRQDFLKAAGRSAAGSTVVLAGLGVATAVVASGRWRAGVDVAEAATSGSATTAIDDSAALLERQASVYGIMLPSKIPFLGKSTNKYFVCRRFSAERSFVLVTTSVSCDW